MQSLRICLGKRHHLPPKAISARVACKQLREGRFQDFCSTQEVAERLDDIFVHQLDRSLPSDGEILH
jgi:hypothetical protein